MVESEGALLPFWSPDSQFVGFWAGGKLKKIRRSGGPPEVICSVAEIAQGAWSPDGTILFARAINSPINRVSPDGANATPATSLLPGQVSHMWVQFLPDGRHFIYLARTNLTSDDPQAKVYAQSLDGGAPIELLTSQSRAIAVPDYLLFAQQQNLFAQRMDWKALRKIGEPLLVARKVAASPAYLGTSEFTASQNGVLIYGTAEGSSFDQLKWYARDGSTIGSLDPVIDYQQFTLSPDAKRLALNSFRQHATGSLWLIDIATDTTTPLTFDPHAQSDPVWSPDSRHVAFNLLPNGGTDPPFLVQRIEIGNQQPHPIYRDDVPHWVEDWSPDGRFLVAHDTQTVSILPLTGDTKPRAVYSSSFRKDAFHLSPDGRLIAYGEDRGGRWEVFAASFPSFQGIKQVSVAGGAQPQWRGDGRELFFIDNEGQMMSATVEHGSPEVGAPKKLFDYGIDSRSNDQSVCSYWRWAQIPGARAAEGLSGNVPCDPQLARYAEVVMRAPAALGTLYVLLWCPHALALNPSLDVKSIRTYRMDLIAMGSCKARSTQSRRRLTVISGSPRKAESFDSTVSGRCRCLLRQGSGFRAPRWEPSWRHATGPSGSAPLMGW